MSIKTLFTVSILSLLVGCQQLTVEEVKSSPTIQEEECVPNPYEPCFSSGIVQKFIKVEVKVKPNSCKGDCASSNLDHTGYSIDTYSHGRVWVEHGNPISKIKVPKGHKVISCYCKQEECLIVAPDKLQGFNLDMSEVNKGGTYTVSVESDDLMD